MEQTWKPMMEQIGQASATERLRLLRDEFHAAWDAAAGTPDAAAVAPLNEVHDAFIRQALAIAEQRVRELYGGSPPVCSFAVLLFGSGGRNEQTMWSDQDNGLVYEPGPGTDPEAAKPYMAELGEAFRRALEETGYPPCEGNVLVSNPVWRQSLAEWRRTLASWLDDPEFESVRRLLIMADARAVYGSAQLAGELRSALLATVASRAAIFPRMVQNTLRYKVLVGWLGNLLTEAYGEDAGGIDIKYGAYIPMVNAVRLLALKYHIGETGTLERLRNLRECGAIEPDAAAAIEEAFRSVLKFRLMTPHRLEDGKYTTRGVLSAAALSKDVRRELKSALRVGAELQRRVKRTFGTEGYV